MEIVDRNVEPGRFQPLLLRHPVDRMVLSEDARYLAAAHREADSISVIDVQSLDLVTTIDTPAPRAILWRGDHLFAANEGLGTISMFSESGQCRPGTYKVVWWHEPFHVAGLWSGKLMSNEVKIEIVASQPDDGVEEPNVVEKPGS